MQPPRTTRVILPVQALEFALNHDKLVDFAYRAMHEMTVQSKTIVGCFYSRPPRLSYYQGCSTGGRQGMMEAQRYPDDFDAIVAGAPVYNMVHLNVSQTALQVHMLKNPERIVPPNKVTLIANAAVAACDANDGVKDGIINDPRACKFDPGTLACKAGDAADCLTPGQVESARQLYSPVKTTSGEVVYPGRSPGVESGWAARIPVVGKPVNPLWGDMPRFVGHRDAKWDVMSFDLENDLALTLKNASFIEASNPDLSKFKARGGKLLLWHGWADPGPAPENTIDYYSAGREGRRRRIAGGLDAAVPDARRRPLRRRSRARSGRLPRRDGTLARAGRRALADHGVTQPRARRPDTDDAAVVPVSADRQVQGHRQHGRRGQLRVRGSVI